MRSNRKQRAWAKRLSSCAIAAAVAFLATGAIAKCVWAGEPEERAAAIERPASAPAPAADSSFTYYESARVCLRAPQAGRADLAFYAELCEQALDRLVPEVDLGAAFPKKIDVRVSPTERDFERETGMSAAHAMAVAFSDRGYIVLNALALQRVDPAERFRTVGHEMTHLLLGLVASGGVRIPAWLHEGLAQLLVGEGTAVGDLARLAWADLWRRRIPMPDLIDSFPYGKPNAPLAYSQAASFTQYLTTEKLGFDAPGDFLAFLLTRPNEAPAMLARLNDPETVAEIDAAWRPHSGISSTAAIVVLSSSGALWGLVVLLFLVAYVRKRLREKSVVEEWDPWER